MFGVMRARSMPPRNICKGGIRSSSYGPHYRDYFRINPASRSMGSGKMMVEFFSAEMELRVWR